MLAQEDGDLGVAVAVEPEAVTVSVLAPSGGGASGLVVRVDGNATQPCGHGCYRAAVQPGRTIDVEVDGRALTFAVPSAAPPANDFIRTATRTFTKLRSVDYVERLASSPTNVIVTRWKLSTLLSDLEPVTPPMTNSTTATARKIHPSRRGVRPRSLVGPDGGTP